jgi:formylglycine-generating enzyme required for sulfatase activity
MPGKGDFYPVVPGLFDCIISWLAHAFKPMPNTRPPLRIFIYHAQGDSETVDALSDLLFSHGVEVTLPEEAELGIDPEVDEQLVAQMRERVLQKVIHEADTIVFCLSDRFNQQASLHQNSEWESVLEEVLKRRQGDLFVIPVRLHECEVPGRLHRWQPVDLYKRAGYEELMQALKTRADILGAELVAQAAWKDNPFAEETEAESADEIPRAALRSVVLRSSVSFLGLLGLSLLIVMASLFLVDFRKDIASATRTTVFVESLAQRATQNIVDRATERAATSTAEAVAISERLIQTEVFLTGIPLTGTAAAERALITPSVTFTPVGLPTQIMDAGDVLMVLVSGGKFIVGLDGDQHASPAHNVDLPAYYIDQYEVTNASYQGCVSAGVCQPPERTNSQTHANYYNDPGLTGYPMLNVNWYMAQSYCEWRGARLPTEAEWEKAARGPEARQYPWGDGADCFLANYNACLGDTSGVDKFAIGISVYGAFNMAGNVAEWTSSLFSPYPYDPEDGREDPASDQPRVLRGGSWASSPEEILTYQRLGLDPSMTGIHGNDVGFRCARAVK